MAGVVLVRRAEEIDEAVESLIHEYYEAAEVVVRDTASALEKYVKAPNGLWVAEVDGSPIGCVILRDLPEVPGSGECKRLYVREAGRGHGIGNKLMDALEEYAGSVGYEYVYLDTHDGLKAALALYERRGYERCERYNDNPQATVFMRKALNPH